VVHSLGFYQDVNERLTASGRRNLEKSLSLTADNRSGSNLTTKRPPAPRIQLGVISKDQPTIIKSNSEQEIKLNSNSLQGKYALFLVGNKINIPLDLSIENSNNNQQGLRIFSNNEPVNPQIIADQDSLSTLKNGASRSLRLPNASRITDLSHSQRTDNSHETLEALLDMSAHSNSDIWHKHYIAKGEGSIEEGLYGILESRNPKLLEKLEEIFSRCKADLEIDLSDNETIFNRALAYLGLEIKNGKNQEELPMSLNRYQIDNIKHDLTLLFLDIDELLIQNTGQRIDIKKSYIEEQTRNNNVQRKEDHLKWTVPLGTLKLISRRDESNNISSLIIKYNQNDTPTKTEIPLSIELRKVE
jgi:hypothetical protein